MPKDHIYEISLVNPTPGTWALSADGALLAGLVGHDDSADALSWAQHTLRSTHGVNVRAWTRDSAVETRLRFHATVTAADSITGQRELFVLTPGRPLPAQSWPGRSPGEVLVVRDEP